MTTTIHLQTYIKAPIQKVFDLSRNISFHIESTSQTKEKAVAGKTSGLIKLNETVTWRGKHFGIYLEHQSKITSFDSPFYFVDEMINGHFKSFRHEHVFLNYADATLMKDILEYEIPYGTVGKIFDHLLIKKHLTKFLSYRNHHLKTRLENTI